MCHRRELSVILEGPNGLWVRSSHSRFLSSSLNPRKMRSFIPVLALAATVFSPSLLAQDNDRDGFEPFVEQPGLLEFSGVLCARPVQAADALARGLDQAQARDLRDEALSHLLTFEVNTYVDATDEFLITLGPGTRENDAARALMATGAFEYVEPDWICYPVACPNDSQFNSQWHHQSNIMESCDGWDLETGDPSVVIAICDTGVLTSHEDLQLHREEGFHAPSNTWENSGGDISPIASHGTMCTGSAAGNGNNGIGISGVGWNLGHRMMRVTDDPGGGASLSNLTLAARTGAEAGDRVSSVSYSGVQSGSVESTGAYIRSLGSLLIWAAGNSNQSMSGNRDDSVIVVGATSSNDLRSSFSNYGPFVDLMAPGSGILTTDSGNSSDYASVSGTSFSCPITAGMCGMIWSADPSLTPQQVEDLLRASCDDLGSVGVDNEYGHGRINLRKAMEDALRPVMIEVLSTLPSFLDPAGGDELEFQVSAGTSVPAPGTGEFWMSTGSGFSPAPIVQLSPNHYLATFPAAPCGSTVQFYVGAQDTGGTTYYEPSLAPAVTWSAVAQIPVAVADDDCEVASGWTTGVPGDDATTGAWERGNPIGTAAQPEDDHSPSGVQCYFTGQGSNGGSLGENDVDSGTTTLVSPTYDLTGLNDPTVSYWRWYSNTTGASPGADSMTIEISNNGGGSWSTVEVVGPSADSSGGWIQHSFLVSSIVTPTANVQLRFMASDLGSGSIVEAAIDDLSITDESCSDCGISNFCAAGSNSTGTFAKMGWNGTSSILSNDLELTCFDLPTGENGLFIQSPDTDTILIGNGLLCLGNSTLGFFIRHGVVNSGPAGAVTYALDNTAPPIPQAQVAAGETWYFQFWFRDNAAGGAGFNFSDGLSVTFCP
ncbi:MAG: hypothetical protein CMJ86_02405 [Planctomycetes bacterium]|nr:hypothetical protein [Planctomycetota bacterium]